MDENCIKEDFITGMSADEQRAKLEDDRERLRTKLKGLNEQNLMVRAKIHGVLQESDFPSTDTTTSMDDDTATYEDDPKLRRRSRIPGSPPRRRPRLRTPPPPVVQMPPTDTPDSLSSEERDAIIEKIVDIRLPTVKPYHSMPSTGQLGRKVESWYPGGWVELIIKSLNDIFTKAGQKNPEEVYPAPEKPPLSFDLYKIDWTDKKYRKLFVGGKGLAIDGDYMYMRPIDEKGDVYFIFFRKNDIQPDFIVKKTNLEFEHSKRFYDEGVKFLDGHTQTADFLIGGPYMQNRELLLNKLNGIGCIQKLDREFLIKDFISGFQWSGDEKGRKEEESQWEIHIKRIMDGMFKLASDSIRRPAAEPAAAGPAAAEPAAAGPAAGEPPTTASYKNKKRRSKRKKKYKKTHKRKKYRKRSKKTHKKKKK